MGRHHRSPDALVMLKSMFAPLIDLVTKAIGKLTDFVSSSPDKVRESFGMPAPCCCLTPVILSMADTLGNLDVDKVKVPLEKFAESANGSVDKLDNVVKAANMSSNPMGGMFG